jgi:hypothetical protein
MELELELKENESWSQNSDNPKPTQRSAEQISDKDIKSLFDTLVCHE